MRRPAAGCREGVAPAPERRPKAAATASRRLAHLVVLLLLFACAPAFACTPDLFPELMAAALDGRDLSQWAAARELV